MASDTQRGEFGARLREAREKRGLSLRVIADTTKISVRALEALEKNDISRLPGGIFSRAFVRGYAIEVGLDPEQTVADFITRFPDEIVTQGHPRTRAIVDELEADARRRSWPTLTWVAVVGVPVVALLIYVGVVGRRVAPVSVQPVAAASPQAAAESTPPLAAAPFSITIHALRATTFRIAPDDRPAFEVGLDAGATRSFEATRELLVTPTDPSALEWSAPGVTARVLTGPLTLTPRTLQSISGP